MSMKLNMEPSEITKGIAAPFCPILELLYSYSYYDEPEYRKIGFMFEKILLDKDIVPSNQNMDWIEENEISQQI